MSLDAIVKGLRWGAAEAGIRRRGGLDVAVVLCAEPAAAAGVLTRSETAAAPVLLSRRRLRSGRAAAILVNAGNANACTPHGDRHARAATSALAAVMGAREEQVLVASTGVIGAPLPVEKLVAAVPAAIADATPDGIERFARAIMTTDTFPKVASARGGRATVLGCAKGAGMIMPDMATMLGFLATDAALAPTRLRAILREVAHATFNAVTVDGDTSTNDSLFLLATGAVRSTGPRTEAQVVRAIHDVAARLARAIAADGEGATRLVEVRVEGARSEADADRIARRIANSPLVKTALHAGDANWGRIAAAAGTAGVRLDRARLEIAIGPAVVARRGVSTGPQAEERATAHLRGREVLVRVRVGGGPGRRTVLTCDLSAAYVKINAEYRT